MGCADSVSTNPLCCDDEDAVAGDAINACAVPEERGVIPPAFVLD